MRKLYFVRPDVLTVTHGSRFCNFALSVWSEHLLAALLF